jgi:Ca2+-binding RTX toxin-like protein
MGVLALVASAVSAVSVAYAQTVPAPTVIGPNVPALQSADVRVNIDNPRSTGSALLEGDRVFYAVDLINKGPTVARDVRLVVDTPRGFNLNEVNQEAECQSNDGDEGRMTCHYAVLAPGVGIDLRFRGAYRGDGGNRVHVYAASATPDPNLANNHDSQRVRVQEKPKPKPKPGIGEPGPVDNRPTCFGERATIVGTDGDDVINGTAGRDVIVGLDGDDQIAADEGDDLVCGNAGDDTINGGSGRDTLHGERGNDTLNAQNGEVDTLIDGGPDTDACAVDTIDPPPFNCES